MAKGKGVEMTVEGEQAENKGDKKEKSGGGVMAALGGVCFGLVFVSILFAGAAVYFNYFGLRTLTLNFLESLEPSGIVRKHLAEENRQIVQQLNDEITVKQVEIDSLKAQLEERDLLNTTTQREVELLRQELAEKTSADEARESTMNNLSKILNGMEPASAARTIVAYPDTNLAVDVLKTLNAKRSAEIFQAMEPEKAAFFMAEMQK